MSCIFKTYTGSAFINNALQTIEVLAGVEDVSDITPQHLLDIYQEKEFWNLFKRMKSYSMLFTRNGPLLNDKQFGEKIYKGLVEYIIKNHETEGKNICEITGLRYQTSFEEIYEKVLLDIGYPVKKIKGKDKSINRCWFPLIGALGSDAQALPQAKFDIKIHPICLVIIQFLPFSALIYKGGILLFDSTNFEFSKDYIKENTERVLKEIQITAENKSVENIKDFNKGTYLLRAIKLYASKKDDYDDLYSDLNLWSFSNSGTGARCNIDRIPDRLFKQLLKLYYDVRCRDDLKQLISDKKLSNFFLEKLEAGLDYWRLYPSKKYEGVGVSFYDHYQKLIKNSRLIRYAKYIAYLLKKEEKLKKAEISLLKKTDAYSFAEYNTLIFTTLIRATENKKWSINYHLQILDKPNDLPILSNIFSIYKMIHFYYQKEEKYLIKNLDADKISSESTKALEVLQLVIPLIEKYETELKVNIRGRLLNPQESKTYSLRPILIREVNQLTLDTIYSFYFEDFKRKGFGLNDLLRIYYSNPTELYASNKFLIIDPVSHLKKYTDWSEIYIHYYFTKYKNEYSQKIPIGKFKKHVLKNFPKNTNLFYFWLEEAKHNMLTFLKENPFTTLSKKEINNLSDDIMYDDLGNKNLIFSRFAIEFSLNKNYLLTHKNIEI